jgi:hypothetical protein
MVILMFGAVASASATTVVTGNLFPVFDAQGARIGSTVDYWYFSVNSPGTVSIDTLSSEIGGVYPDGLVWYDVNGDGEDAFFDPFIWLFADDGSLDAGDMIAQNDDSNDTYADGSISELDSYLSLDLTDGDYILAIGTYDLTIDDAVDGLNDTLWDDDYPYPIDFDYNPIDHGDYQITFDGDVTVQQAVIPETGTIFLLGGGLLGLLALKRKLCK